MNAICPIAYSRITEKILDKEFEEYFTPELITPAVGWLCHKDFMDNGGIFEIAGGSIKKVRLQKSSG